MVLYESLVLGLVVFGRFHKGESAVVGWVHQKCEGLLL